SQARAKQEPSKSQARAKQEPSKGQAKAKQRPSKGQRKPAEANRCRCGGNAVAMQLAGCRPMLAVAIL
ncbi:MAG: hypothetical protein QJR04_27000, partial [Burkholderia multivorans]|nr:hypothetical protein [Burkholderia multivorans]